MIHKANKNFWKEFGKLPSNIQSLATQNFQTLQTKPQHPSLHFKKVGNYWSVRIGISYRALAIKTEDTYIWFWIGTHAKYDTQT